MSDPQRSASLDADVATLSDYSQASPNIPTSHPSATAIGHYASPSTHTLTDERTVESSRTSSADRLHRGLSPGGVVDVSRAEHEFLEFSRSLQRRSGMYQWDAGSGETISGATAQPPARQNSTRLSRLSNRLSGGFVNRLSPTYQNTGSQLQQQQQQQRQQSFPTPLNSDSRYPTIPQNDYELQLSPRSRSERYESMERELKHSASHATFLGSPNDILEEPHDHDLEKGKRPPQDGDVFDLREYLTSSNDANDKAGIKHKHVGVTWENLSVDVVGAAGMKFYAENLGDAFMSLYKVPLNMVLNLIGPLLSSSGGPPTRSVLHPSSGVLKPGEMCLVLGCPGSGCTEFLRTITNQREGYANVGGKVLYAGMDAAEMAKYYKGEVVYNEEDDIHIPTLTVAQTLQFALSTKTPGPKGRVPGLTRQEFDNEVLDLLLRMLNISHTRNTLVGNEFVRGVSGGERKRVSIAEMMATRARVQAWDNSTRGLDASTALDFTKCLRIMTDILGQTTFVTLYQAGEGIYELFDKVMVLNQGRQVYFGPPNEARAYFEGLGFKSLPRQSTADYLTGCTDPNERQFAPGRSEKNVPCSPEDMEQAFLGSVQARDNEKARQKYEMFMVTEKADQEAFRTAVADDKKRGVSKKSPYTQSYWGQVRALTKRQFSQRLQDRFQLVTSFGLSWGLALINGGAYFDQPLSSQGAFTRGGLIFISTFMNCLDAFGEMPVQMIGRPIMRKQTSYTLYRPSATALANTLADIPFSALRIFIFNVIVYFMAGLSRSAGGFFTFHIMTYVVFLAVQGMFRTFGMLCRNFDSAFRISTFVLPNFVQYSGYLIPVISMKRWLFWIYYINPMAYAWEGCMENEFMRIDFTCDGNSIVPRNGLGITKYPNEVGPNQACTLFGATTGSTTIPGRDYVSIGFGIDVSDVWRRCFLVLVGFALLFQVTQIIALDYFPQYSHAAPVSLFVKENAETKALNERLRQRKGQQTGERHNEDKAVTETQKFQNGADGVYRKSFTWEKLNYHVPYEGGQKRLLHDVYGYVKPGTLTALMGSSGAGKTTCLDVLAQRKNIGVITGDLLVDGRPLDSDFARGTAYAEQMDVHEGTATIREAMRFSAYLRQPASVSKEEKDAYVEDMIELLELQDLSESLVFSLNVEARKRLTIGVELASKPELLLFLDEPTSGLDAQSAWNLVRFLRKLADQGQAILCTIHQPSAMLFESFDRLLLLERGGETVYFGDIGRDSRVIREYFARYGAVCPPNVNPAEYMLEAIGAGVMPRVGDRAWSDIWRDSPEFQGVLNEIAQVRSFGLARPEEGKTHSSTYATSFFFQLRTVILRNNLALWRSPDYIFTRFYVVTLISLLVSLPLLQLGHSLRELQMRAFSIFWVGLLPMIIMTQIEPMFIMNRRTFIRESSSRIYSPYVFAMGQLIGEIPYSLIAGVLYWVLMVYPQHFGQGSAGLNGTGFQLLVVLFMMLFGISLGQLLSAISPSVQVAVLFNPFFGLVFNTFSGIPIPYPSMAKFWRSWLYQLVPFTRFNAAMLSTELQGLEVICEPEEFNHFSPPTGQTCQQWAGDFIDKFGGYLQNPNSTDTCNYCQYKYGQEFFEPLNMSYALRWRDTFIVLAFFGFNMLATIAASRFLRYAKR